MMSCDVSLSSFRCSGLRDSHWLRRQCRYCPVHTTSEVGWGSSGAVAVVRWQWCGGSGAVAVVGWYESPHPRSE